jgi:hypothetical protein
MPWSWVWGEKKAPVKKVEVETVNTELPKTVTRIGVRVEIDLEHPTGLSAFATVLDSKLQFVLPDGNEVKSGSITDIEVLS